MDIQMEIQVKKQILFISFFPVCDASDFVRDHVGDVHLQVENPSTWPEGYTSTKPWNELMAFRKQLVSGTNSINFLYLAMI